MKKEYWLALVMALILTGCASNKQAQQQAAGGNSDPLESINRPIWEFNWEVLDENVLRPAAIAYVEYTPTGLRKGLHNAALNLEEPANSLNNLLQGKVTDSFSSLGRFVVNSTIGLLGLVDVATDIGMERKEEEFGETLGVWGIDTGPFLMLPALGPSDARSLTGDVVDSSYFPITDLSGSVLIFSSLITALESRAELVAQEQLLYDAVDSYSLLKNVYFQNLANNVADGQLEPSNVDTSEEDAELDDLLEDF